MLRRRSEPVEFVSLLDLTDDLHDGVTDVNSAHVGSPAGGQQLGASASHGSKMAHRGGFETRKDGSGNGGGGNDDDDDEWSSVERELRLLRKGGVSLMRECELAAVVGVEAAAREEAARAAARLRRFAGSEGTSLLREVTE
jgi:hypothetical protein